MCQLSADVSVGWSGAFSSVGRPTVRLTRLHHLLVPRRLRCRQRRGCRIVQGARVLVLGLPQPLLRLLQRRTPRRHHTLRPRNVSLLPRRLRPCRLRLLPLARRGDPRGLAVRAVSEHGRRTPPRPRKHEGVVGASASARTSASSASRAAARIAASASRASCPAAAAAACACASSSSAAASAACASASSLLARSSACSASNASIAAAWSAASPPSRRARSRTAVRRAWRAAAADAAGKLAAQLSSTSPAGSSQPAMGCSVCQVSTPSMAATGSSICPMGSLELSRSQSYLR
jgi:hypothetical protein